MKYTVAIIGAGVVGGMVARELSRYNVSVCLLERENDVAMGSSKANSGIVHGGFDPEPGTLKAKLNTVGVEKLFAAAKELNVPHKRNGSFVCAFSEEEIPALEELYQRGLENDIPGLSLISGEEAREKEPNLSPEVVKVLDVTNAGIICPYELTVAAVGNAMDNGVTLVRGFEVADIRRDGAYTVTAKNGETVTCDYLINCAGGYSDKIAQMVGDDSFTILPRAGEYMLLDKAEGARVSRTIFQVPTKEGKGILVSPTVDGNLLTGPTAGLVDSPDNTEITQKNLDIILALAGKSVPSVQFRQVITSFTGVRASTKGGDFIINRKDNFVNAAAIDSPGLTCCVAIAEYVVNLLREGGLALEAKADFDGTRENPHAFREMSVAEKDAYIKENPAYGKIVCRCETVSEGEIRAAILRNPPAFDVDSVKRRTRSGMGRCQGGFCMPYVMRLISELHNIPLEEVTKKGTGSEVLIRKI